MKSNKKHRKNGEKERFVITEKGSLGILALGDVGLRAWRKVKQDLKKGDRE